MILRHLMVAMSLFVLSRSQVILFDSTQLSVMEGNEARIQARLGVKPSSSVQIQFSINFGSSNNDFLYTPELTYTVSDWDRNQPFIVSLPDNVIVHGTRVYDVNMKVLSADNTFNGAIIQPLVVSIGDDEVPQILLASSGDLTYENDRTIGVEISARLSNQPVQTDIITVSITTNSREAVASPTQLVFTPFNWSSPATVSITSLDDQLADGNTRYPVQFTATSILSSTSAYHGITASVNITNVDDEVAALVFDPPFVDMNEGENFIVQVTLRFEPLLDVRVQAPSSDGIDAAVTQGNSLTFTKNSWNAPQAVSFQGKSDQVIDGDYFRTMMFTVTSLDPAWNQLTFPLNVTIRDTMGYSFLRFIPYEIRSGVNPWSITKFSELHIIGSTPNRGYQQINMSEAIVHCQGGITSSSSLCNLTVNPSLLADGNIFTSIDLAMGNIIQVSFVKPKAFCGVSITTSSSDLLLDPTGWRVQIKEQQLSDWITVLNSSVNVAPGRNSLSEWVNFCPIVGITPEPAAIITPTPTVVVGPTAPPSTNKPPAGTPIPKATPRPPVKTIAPDTVTDPETTVTQVPEPVSSSDDSSSTVPLTIIIAVVLVVAALGLLYYRSVRTKEKDGKKMMHEGDEFTDRNAPPGRELNDLGKGENPSAVENDFHGPVVEEIFSHSSMAAPIELPDEELSSATYAPLPSYMEEKMGGVSLGRGRPPTSFSEEFVRNYQQNNFGPGPIRSLGRGALYT